MSEFNATFSFVCDNQQLALDEIEQQVKNAGLSVTDLEVMDTIETDHEDDWFDDYEFIIRGNVTSDVYSVQQMKEILYNNVSEYTGGK